MKRWTGIALLGVAALFLVAPALAGAADATRDLVIDFQGAGPMRDLLGKTIGVAKSFLFFSAFLAYALEALGHSPTAPRDYGAVTWRLLIVLFLVWNYQTVFGSIINLLDGIEQQVAPPSTWDALKAGVQDGQKALTEIASDGEKDQGSGSSGGKVSRFTSWVYEALISVVLLLGQGLVFLIRWISKILTATLFVLGPLALVAGIPRMSSTGSRWFHRFVTIASWPIFASVLLAVMVALRGQGTLHRTYLECLVAALVLVVTALATPSLASQVVGGTLQNFAAAGYFTARRSHREAVVPAVHGVVTVVGGMASGSRGVVHRLTAFAGRSSGSAGGGQGSSGGSGGAAAGGGSGAAGGAGGSGRGGGGGSGGQAGGISPNPPSPPGRPRPRRRRRPVP